MDYTIENGRFYKVLENGVIVTFGELDKDTVLATRCEVVFISQQEFEELEAEHNKEKP